MRPTLLRAGINGGMKRRFVVDDDDACPPALVDGSDVLATVTVLRSAGSRPA